MEGQQQSLSLFQPTPIEKTIIKHQIVVSTVEFNLPGTATDYINLKKSKLHVKAKVTLADGTTISAHVDAFGLGNFYPSILSSDKSMSICNRKIFPQILVFPSQSNVGLTTSHRFK